MLEAGSRGSRPGPVLVGPGDDACVLQPQPGEALVLSSDVSVEGVHFRREWLTWEGIGYRAAAVALSDLAAMAAKPIGVLISLAMPPELDLPVYEQFASGVADCLRSCEGTLLGGDTSSSPSAAFVDVVAVGSVAEAVTRGGARPGDELWVTGRLGAAAAAVMALGSGLEPQPEDRMAYERPIPRWREARWLAGTASITAAIDLSDGLAGDAAHLAEASQCALAIEVDRIPLADSLRGWADESVAMSIAAGGGDDYEILCCVPPGVLEGTADQFRKEFGVELTRIGTVGEGSGVRWVDGAGEPVDPPAPAGYDHFTDRE